MNERQILLADGTALEGCDLSCADGNLWIWCALSMRQGAKLFLNSAKTAEIRYRRGEQTEVYTGFTDCLLLQLAGGALRVQLSGTGTEVGYERDSEGDA